MAIHRLRKLGENETGEKAGFELPRDDPRLEGLIDESGDLRERPHASIERVDDGVWRFELLDGDDGPDLEWSNCGRFRLVREGVKT